MGKEEYLILVHVMRAAHDSMRNLNIFKSMCTYVVSREKDEYRIVL